MKYENLLSEKGKYINDYVDLTGGTLAWSLYAKDKAKGYPGFINATIGSATNDDGTLMILETLKEEFANLTGDQLFGYANVRGVPSFIKAWQQDTLETFPTELRKKAEKLSTLPVTACGGLTAGLSVVGQVFFSRGDTFLAPRCRWGNVDNVFFKNQRLKERTYPIINENGELHLNGLIESMKKTAKESKKFGIYLNFPNNPSGISPTMEQLKYFQEAIEELDTPAIIILDDAYEGYVYEKDAINHSLFPHLIGLNPDVLVVKVDGVSKRYFAYGTRLGLVTIGFGQEVDEKTKDDFRELLAKSARTIASSSPRGIQEAMANILTDPKKKAKIKKEKERNIKILEKRYRTLKALLKERDNDRAVFTAAKFNSGFFGYFLVVKQMKPKEIAQELLSRGLGVVPFINKETGLHGIRFAFCSVKNEEIEKAVDIIYSIEK